MIKINLENMEITVGGKVGWGISSIAEYLQKTHSLTLTNDDLLFLNAVLQDVEDGEFIDEEI